MKSRDEGLHWELALEAAGVRIGTAVHPYAAVKHLGYRARTSGFWPARTHRVTVLVWIGGRAEPYVIEAKFRGTAAGMRAATAYHELSERTFDARLAPYVETLRTTGSFDYSEATFFTDGTCNKSGHMYDLKGCRVTREGPEWVFSSRASPLQLRLDGTLDPDVLRRLFTDELALDVAE